MQSSSAERHPKPLEQKQDSPAPCSTATGAPGLVVEVKNNNNCHIDMSQSTFTFNNEGLGGGSALAVERPHSSTQTLKFKAGAVPGVEVLPGHRDDIMTVKRAPADLHGEEAREQKKRTAKKTNVLSFMMGHKPTLSKPSAFRCKHCPKTFTSKQGRSNHERSCPLRLAKAPKGSSIVRPTESAAAKDVDAQAALGNDAGEASDAAAASDTPNGTEATTTTTTITGPTSNPTSKGGAGGASGAAAKIAGKKDGRRGAPVRRSHSWSFKSRVLRQYDWYKMVARNDSTGAGTFGRRLDRTSSMTPALMTAMQFCISDTLVCVCTISPCLFVSLPPSLIAPFNHTRARAVTTRALYGARVVIMIVNSNSIQFN